MYRCRICGRRLTIHDLRYEYDHQSAPDCGHTWQDYTPVAPAAPTPRPKAESGTSMAPAFLFVGLLFLFDLVVWFLETFVTHTHF